MRQIEKIKSCLQAILFVILLIAFYIIYMRNALEQFNAGKTTMAQTQNNLKELESPILILCPEPPFKPSYFKSQGINHSFVEKYFWTPMFFQEFEDQLTSVFDTYMNMSYQLGSDWEINTLVVDG